MAARVLMATLMPRGDMPSPLPGQFISFRHYRGTMINARRRSEVATLLAARAPLSLRAAATVGYMRSRAPRMTSRSPARINYIDTRRDVSMMPCIPCQNARFQCKYTHAADDIFTYRKVQWLLPPNYFYLLL